MQNLAKRHSFSRNARVPRDSNSKRRQASGMPSIRIAQSVLVKQNPRNYSESSVKNTYYWMNQPKLHPQWQQRQWPTSCTCLVFVKKVSEGKRRKPTRNHKSFLWCRASLFISDQILRPPHVTSNCHARLSPAHC